MHEDAVSEKEEEVVVSGESSPGHKLGGPSGEGGDDAEYDDGREEVDEEEEDDGVWVAPVIPADDADPLTRKYSAEELELTAVRYSIRLRLV